MADPILIVGSDGFLGSNLRRWLDQRGLAWHGIGRSSGDLAEPGVADAAFAAAPPAGLILHTATRQRTGPTQYGLQGELLLINSRIHLNVLEAWRTRQPQAKLVSMGSSCGYPERYQPLPESLFGEGPLHPSVIGYAQAKLLLARGSEAYAGQYGLSFLHCVLATLYGPDDHKAADRSHFMGALIDRAVREQRSGAESFTVWGAPETVRDLLYVDDQIAAVFAAAAAFENRVLNCAANAPVTVGEAAEAILEQLGWRAPLSFPTGSFEGTRYKTLECSDFLSAVDWRPQVSLREGIGRVLRSDYGLRRV